MGWYLRQFIIQCVILVAMYVQSQMLASGRWQHDLCASMTYVSGGSFCSCFEGFIIYISQDSVCVIYTIFDIIRWSGSLKRGAHVTLKGVALLGIWQFLLCFKGCAISVMFHWQWWREIWAAHNEQLQFASILFFFKDAFTMMSIFIHTGPLGRFLDCTLVHQWCYSHEVTSCE